jgi:hypothetical protein
MIVGVTERIVELCEAEMRVGLLDRLDRVAGSETLVNQPDRNTSSDNHGVTPADRGIFMDIAMVGLDCLGHETRLPMVMDDRPTVPACTVAVKPQGEPQRQGHSAGRHDHDTGQGPDPRFGMQAPLTATLSVKLPSGLTSTRTAVLSNPLDL